MKFPNPQIQESQWVPSRKKKKKEEEEEKEESRRLLTSRKASCPWRESIEYYETPLCINVITSNIDKTQNIVRAKRSWNMYTFLGCVCVCGRQTDWDLRSRSQKWVLPFTVRRESIISKTEKEKQNLISRKILLLEKNKDINTSKNSSKCWELLTWGVWIQS